MDINLENYRNRIGSFNTAGRFRYIHTRTRKQSYKDSTRTIYNFRKIAVCMVLMISILSRIEEVPQVQVQDPHIQLNSVNYIAKATDPVSYIIFGGQAATFCFPTMHLSFHDVLAVHSAATVQGVQAGDLDKGWVVAATLLQSSILSDSNFYARYTYGNRSNRGIKLSHWNAGSAHLENKTNEIENLISDHHPHLLGISEANLHKDHCMDNCKIEDYDLITCNTLRNESLCMSRVVV